jgi:deazaflavin-dependent oxidoreductase (nitroreductase family)
MKARNLFPEGTMTMSGEKPAAAPRSHGLVLSLTRLFNPLVVRLAGSRLLPIYGLLRHRGRRSGKDFRIPVIVQRTSDGFIVPMPWGESTDWYRNVRAAGACVIRWKGHDYSLVQPEVIDAARVKTGFGAPARAFMNGLGISQCLRLRERS